MNRTNTKALIESFKQLMRSIIFILIAWLLSGSIIALIIEIFFGAKLDGPMKLQVIGALTLLIQYIDKALHESTVKVNGLLPETPIT